jgi:hypothetical protein
MEPQSVSNEKRVGLCTKRIRNELKRDVGNKPTLVSDPIEERRITVQNCDIILECPRDYPFNPPRIINSPRRLLTTDFWAWFGTIFMRETNRLYFPSCTQCLCCTSPTCDWHPQRSMREITDHLMCVQDVTRAFLYRRMYQRIFDCFLVPRDVVLKIAEFA